MLEPQSSGITISDNNNRYINNDVLNNNISLNSSILSLIDFKYFFNRAKL
jgi:hypothetical protein